MDKVYSVGQVNRYIKSVLENDRLLKVLMIKGEISNFKAHYSGHLYFTLKDEQSSIKCVMFKPYAIKLKFNPKDGDSVIISCSVGVFERDGAYQLYVNDMQPDGIGQLYLAYEQLKEKLEKEGLFDSKYKKRIPYMPSCIGVLTSKTGSVIRDIINVSTRRFPKVKIKIIPVAVQGEGASKTIADGIKKFNELKNVDVIIVARGGGSIEDLWPFNEEIVARSVFESDIPIISAVGHETDFTICDFVADLRAPTPSAAAEIAIPNYSDIIFKLDNIRDKLKKALSMMIVIKRKKLEFLENSRGFRKPIDMINQYRMILDSYIKNLQKDIKMKFQSSIAKYEKTVMQLDSISPLKTLSRGYSIIQDEKGNTIKTIKTLKKGDVIGIVLKDGQKNAIVE